jgi:hypothetical protein
MTETDDTQPDGGDGDSNDDLGGVLGEVGLDYGDDEAGDEADDTTDADEDEDAIESTETETEADTSGSESAETSDDDDSVADGDEQSGAASESASKPEAGADDGPFAPEPEMQLTESFGTKLTPPEKEFVELYVEFSDEYDNPGAFLREFVRQLRQEHGQEVMRRKQALEELKGGL